MTNKEKLVKIKELLNSKGWAKNWWSFDSRGKEVFPDDQTACTFCIGGGILKVDDGKFHASDLKQIIKESIKVLFPSFKDHENNVNISEFNDHDSTTLEQVNRVLDHAIENCKD